MVTLTGNAKEGYIVETDSLIELVDWADREAESHKQHSQNWKQSPRQDWDMGAGYAGALELVKKGWHVGTQELTARLDQIKHRTELEPSGYFADVSGQFFDIGRVMTGEPECWFEQDMEEKRRVVRIAVNTMTVHNVPSDLVKNRGAALVALIEKLQQEKFIVELDVVLHCGDVGRTKSVTVKLSFKTDPLDIDAITFCLAHPAFFRRIGLLLMEAAVKGDCGMYGSAPSSYYKDETADVCLGEPIWLKHDQTDQFKTIQGAADWVNREAARLFGQQD